MQRFNPGLSRGLQTSKTTRTVFAITTKQVTKALFIKSVLWLVFYHPERTKIHKNKPLMIFKYLYLLFFLVKKTFFEYFIDKNKTLY
jgi:hypothetical protein